MIFFSLGRCQASSPDEQGHELSFLQPVQLDKILNIVTDRSDADSWLATPNHNKL